MSALVPGFQLFCNSIHALIKFVQAPLDNTDMPLMLSAMILVAIFIDELYPPPQILECLLIRLGIANFKIGKLIYCFIFPQRNGKMPVRMQNILIYFI